MKNISTILLTMFIVSLSCVAFTSCAGQEAKTLDYFTVPDYVSLQAKIDSCSALIGELREANALLSAQLSLDNTVEIKDTFSLVLSGVTDQTITSLYKTGETVSITIQNGNKRISSLFSETGLRRTYFMNDLESGASYTVGSYLLDSLDSPAIHYELPR